MVDTMHRFETHQDQNATSRVRAVQHALLALISIWAYVARATCRGYQGQREAPAVLTAA